jgi:import inner membrane translocase subunit TIM8
MSSSEESQQQVSPQLQQFIAQEQAKAQVRCLYCSVMRMNNFLIAMIDIVQLQQTISRLTDECWDKCVSSPGTYFTGRENACLDNCAKRFLDTTQFVIKYYQSKAGRGQHDSLDEFS